MAIRRLFIRNLRWCTLFNSKTVNLGHSSHPKSWLFKRNAKFNQCPMHRPMLVSASVADEYLTQLQSRCTWQGVPCGSSPRSLRLQALWSFGHLLMRHPFRSPSACSVTTHTPRAKSNFPSLVNELPTEKTPYPHRLGLTIRPDQKDLTHLITLPFDINTSLDTANVTPRT